jgi:hypothetical protein
MELLGGLAFLVGERRFRYADVVETARAWGDWARIEALAREGGDPIDADAFRYARGLLSGDEMRAWLARWDVGFDQWQRWLAREVPREAVVEAVCSGELERLTRKLAERAAVWESCDAAVWDGSGASVRGGSGVAVRDQSGPALRDGVDAAVWGAAIEAHYAAWREAVVTPPAIERVLSAHRLDWTRVRCVLLRTPDEGVAAEAALCVREDGRDLVAVAGDAGLERADERLYLSDTPLGPRLIGARVGELVGPLAVGGELVLALVTEREAPSPEDPEIRARAREAVADRAVETELLRRVRWAR